MIDWNLRPFDLKEADTHEYGGRPTSLPPRPFVFAINQHQVGNLDLLCKIRTLYPYARIVVSRLIRRS